MSRYGPLDPFIRLTFELMEKNEIGQWQTLPSSLNNRLDADNNFRRQICFLCTSICLGHLIHSSVDDSLPSADVNSTVLDLGMSFFYFHVKWCDSSGRLVQSDATTLRGIVPRHSSSESFQQSLFFRGKIWKLLLDICLQKIRRKFSKDQFKVYSQLYYLAQSTHKSQFKKSGLLSTL